MIEIIGRCLSEGSLVVWFCVEHCCFDHVLSSFGVIISRVPEVLQSQFIDLPALFDHYCMILLPAHVPDNAYAVH